MVRSNGLVPVREDFDPAPGPATTARIVLEMIPEAVFFLVPPSWRIVDVNRAACASLGYSRSELLSMRLPEIAPRIQHGCTGVTIDEVVSGEVSQARVLIIHRHKSGIEFPVDAYVRRLDAERQGTLVAVVRDMRDRNAAGGPPAASNYRDPLTGLPTRAWLDERLQQAAQRARRGDYRFAVLFIDVDCLKRVNDSLGHRAGDKVLRAVTERLRACLRPADAVVRYGGDEFVVLVDDVRSEVEPLRVARRVSRSIRQSVGVSESRGRRTAVTASIGIAIGSDEPCSISELVDRADRAMYRAKSLGRNGCWVLDASPRKPR
ncbi:MAG: sensor domain-containing diguanylate cyclase [Thermoguttaceae bacterium]